MRTRRVAAVVYYNGAAINTTLENYNEGFSYTDFASGESDTFNITLCDSMRQWMTGWLPRKGDRIRAAIRVIDWEREGDDRSFDCGDFTLDDFSFSGAPTAMTLSAIATPVQEEFKTRTRTQTWEDVTIQGIAGEIAGRYGLALYYDAGVINLKNVEQTGKNDCDFLNGICQQYGLAMKVYSNRLVIFDREAYKAKPEVITLDETEMVSWSWNTTLTGTYTSGEFTYTDGENEKEIKVNIGSGGRQLKINAKADSEGDAQRQLKAAMDNGNHGTTTLTVTIMGDPRFTAAQVIAVTGIGRLSGKYYIDKVTHNIAGSGYTMTLDMSLVQEASGAVLADALQRMEDMGVVHDADYWLAHQNDMPYLAELLTNIATHLRHTRGDTGSIATVDAALDVLAAEGVINGKSYWAANHASVPRMAAVLVNAANAIRR